MRLFLSRTIPVPKDIDVSRPGLPPAEIATRLGVPPARALELSSYRGPVDQLLQDPAILTDYGVRQAAQLTNMIQAGGAVDATATAYLRRLVDTQPASPELVRLPGQRLALHSLRQYEARLSSENFHERRSALSEITRNIARLHETDRVSWLPKVEPCLTDDFPEVRETAFEALTQLILYLPPPHRTAGLQKLELLLKAEDDNSRHFAIETLIETLLLSYDMPLPVRRLKIREYLRLSGIELQRAALQKMLKMLPILSEAEHLDFIQEIDEHLATQNDRSLQQDCVRKLAETIALLPKKHRLRYLHLRTERIGLKNLPIMQPPLILSGISAEVLQAEAKRDANPALLRLADYHAAGLPWTPYFWDRYVQSNDPESHLSETVKELSRWRRGAPLVLADERELRFAHAGLDDPAGLSFERFEAELDTTLPPPLFLKAAFTALVPERRFVHHVIDKGKLRQALEPLEQLQDGAALKNWLTGVIQEKSDAIEPIRPQLQAFLSADRRESIDEWREAVAALLPRLRQLRAAPPVRDLITRLILFLGWHGEGIEAMKERIETVRVELNKHPKHQRLSSAELRDGLLAAEEFYRDTLADVMAECGIDERELVLIRKQRRLLAKELKCLRSERGETVLVECVPSKSQSDRYFAHVCEDCNTGRGRAIDHSDFQLYRMLVKDRRVLVTDRLVGEIYLLQARLNRKKALVLAIQPRTTWEIDHDVLLRVIEENFARIAENSGYDYVLMSAETAVQTNRLDMEQAIDLRGYRKITFKKDYISGPVFHGSQFLVMWRKGKRIRHAIDVRSAKPQPRPPQVRAERETAHLPPVLVQETRNGFDWAAFQRMFDQARAQLPLAVREKSSLVTPELRREIAAAMAAAGVQTQPLGYGFGPAEQGSDETRYLPTSALAQAGKLIRYGQMAPPGALVLLHKHPLAIFLNERLTRTDRGWIEPTLEGKKRVIETEAGIDRLPARGDEVTPQELYDFYHIVFHQGLHFRGYLILLKNRGAEIDDLEPIVEQLEDGLKEGLAQLLARRFDQALATFQQVDQTVKEFQRIMREIAHEVGLDIDPVTGMIFPHAVSRRDP